MILKFALRRAPSRPGRRGPLLTLCLLLVAASLFAQSYYLASGRPDGVAWLAPPPAAGSAEEAADLASARAVFKGRTPAEEARAAKDDSLSLFLFVPAGGQCQHLPGFPDELIALIRFASQCRGKLVLARPGGL